MYYGQAFGPLCGVKAAVRRVLCRCWCGYNLSLHGTAICCELCNMLVLHLLTYMIEHWQ